MRSASFDTHAHAQINQTTTTKWRFYTTTKRKRNVIFLRDKSARPYTTVPNKFFLTLSPLPPLRAVFHPYSKCSKTFLKNWMDIEKVGWR